MALHAAADAVGVANAAALAPYAVAGAGACSAAIAHTAGCNVLE